MFITVIIPTFNRADSIGNTIESFMEQTYPHDQYEIIVCDNNSKDNVREVVYKYIREYGDDRISYLLEKKQGAHNARNKAAKYARGELLYFTDDDMIADKNLLRSMADIFQKNDKVGCATGRVLPNWECKPPQWVVKTCQNGLLSLNDQGRFNKICQYDLGVYSCHEAIRRNVFFATNGFHPDYIRGVLMGDGETGLNQEIKQKGYYFAYVGNSVIYHKIPRYRMTQKYLNNRLRNQGNADSYTEYRLHPFYRKDLIKRNIGYFFGYLKYLKEYMVEYNSLEIMVRFAIAYLGYYISRSIYDFQLVHNDIMRKYVLKNDFME